MAPVDVSMQVTGTPVCSGSTALWRPLMRKTKFFLKKNQNQNTQQTFLTELRCFDYSTLHAWASFPQALLLSCEGQCRDPSACPAEPSKGSHLYPCFGSPTPSPCVWIVVQDFRTEICCYKTLGPVLAWSAGLHVCSRAGEGTEHLQTTSPYLSHKTILTL